MISGNAVPQVQNDPVYSLPHLYIAGCNISVASTTIIAIAPGQVRDSNDIIDMPVGSPNLENIPDVAPLFLNSAVTGANGLDVGTLALSSNYAIYIIGDSRYYKPVAGIISLASNAFPLLPLGYDSYRLIGFASTNSSTQFTAGSILNTAYSKSYYLSPAVSVLSGGNATTFTAINLSSAIPGDPFAIAILNVTFTPAAVGDTVQFRGTGSTATAGLVTITGIAVGVPQVQQVQVIVGISGGNAEVDYKVTASGDSVNVAVAGYSITLS